MPDESVSLAIQVPQVALTYDKGALRKVLRAAGAEVAAVTRSMLKNSVGTGRTYYGPGGSMKYRSGGGQHGKYQASAAGQPPVKVTGTLAKSLKVVPFKSGDGVAVRENIFYALFLAAGAKGGGRRGSGGKKVRGKRGIGQSRVLDPRPSLSAALADREASIASRVQDAVRQGLKFVRVKP